jgi:cadmium resistance transport/sequestration family protein
LDTLAAALATFAATNIDDLVLLVLFFGETGPHNRSQVVVGQYLGFVVLVFISLVGFLGRLVFAREWLGLLGIVPIAIGLRVLLFVDKSEDDEAQVLRQMRRPARASWLSSVLGPRTYTVAAVTLANGGDNIGLYTPLFANSDVTQLIITTGTFLVLVAVWCLTAQRLARQRGVAALIAKYGQIAMPFVLIGLGVCIIAGARAGGLP